MGNEEIRKLRNRVKIGWILIIVDIIFIAVVFNLDVPYLIMVVFVTIMMTLVSVGMAMVILYSIEANNKVSEKTVQRVDEFVQEWEREKWQKP